MATKIIFIHGIGSKPSKSKHIEEWSRALLPGAASPTFRMAYWADLRGEELSIPTKGEAKDMVRKMLSPEQQQILAETDSYRKKFLPWWRRGLNLLQDSALTVAEPFVRFALDQHVDDVYNYFYREGRRDAILNRVYDEWDPILAAGDELILMTHSMGTVIGLDAIQHRPEAPVKLFITAGSPLGLEYIQKSLGNPAFPRGVEWWLNVFDRTDPVTRPDQRIKNDFGDDDRLQDNQCRDNYREDGQRSPHSWYGYLTCVEIQDAVDRAMGLVKGRTVL